LAWQDFLLCQGLGLGIGTDCFGAAMPAVRYDSPTWGGFRFETSYGTNTLTPGGYPYTTTTESNFWDVAVFYTGDWNSIKLSAAAAYTWQESGFLTDGYNNNGNFGSHSVDLWQAGASIMHKPSGFGIYGMYQKEDSGGHNDFLVGADFAGLDGQAVFHRANNPDTNAWYLKPFWRKAFSWNGVGLGSLGATVLYGEYGKYNDQFSGGAGDICGAFAGLGGTNTNAFCNSGSIGPTGLEFATGTFVTGSEVQRYGLGVVQEIDAAAMHLFARWQHQELDLDLAGYTQRIEDCPEGTCGSVRKSKVGQGFDDWDLFQVGGVIFF
jgi:hypothetical protein